MWTYSIAFTKDLARFLMVRSKKRGGWEMPGGRMEPGETLLSSAEREFLEETGHKLITDGHLSRKLGDGMVFFGIIGPKVSDRMEGEITEVTLFEKLPDVLAYPHEEYVPLIEVGREMLKKGGRAII